MTIKKIASSTFTAALVAEGSWGSKEQGTHESTMALYTTRNPDKLFIEWDIPALDVTEEIGLWFDDTGLIDYDGVMSLPKQAIELLRESGYHVGKDFE